MDCVHSGVNGVIEYPAMPVAPQMNRLPVIPIPKKQSDNEEEFLWQWCEGALVPHTCTRFLDFLITPEYTLWIRGCKYGTIWYTQAETKYDKW